MVRTRTTVKSIHSLTPKERQACLRLNMGTRGRMKERFLIQERYEGKDTQIILHYDKFGAVDGWAMMFEAWNKKKDVYFYVRKSSRQQGIGTKLLKRAMKVTSEIEVHPWDLASTRLFMKHKLPVPPVYKRMYGVRA